MSLWPFKQVDSGPLFSFFGAVIGLLLFMVLLFGPGYMEARSGGSNLTACKSNLKNLGTAVEMYSTDHSGKYPAKLSQLTPNYLKTILTCPSAGTSTYTYQTGPKAAYNTPGYEDYYFIECKGDNHSDGSPNFPQYDSINGLYEAP